MRIACTRCGHEIVYKRGEMLQAIEQHLIKHHGREPLAVGDSGEKRFNPVTFEDLWRWSKGASTSTQLPAIDEKE